MIRKVNNRLLDLITHELDFILYAQYPDLPPLCGPLCSCRVDHAGQRRPGIPSSLSSLVSENLTFLPRSSFPLRPSIALVPTSSGPS